MDTINPTMSSSLAVENQAVSSKSTSYPLYDKWVLWAHLPHDTDWGIKSYKKICRILYKHDETV